MTTASKIVASCHGWPPWATATLPDAFTFSMAATSSSQLVEDRLVGPDPVRRVHVDRRRDPLALVDGEELQRLGNHRVPTALGRDRSDVGESAFLGPVKSVEAEHLHRGRRVAGG